MSESQNTFKRILKQREVLALSFGAMVGWSWVLMTGHWVEQAGSLGVLIAFVGGGFVILLVALTYAELASALPRAGGEHVYTHRALGPTWSFICTWALLMAYTTVCMFESVALPTAIEFLLPQIRFETLWTISDYEVDAGFVIVGILGAIAMTFINYVGIKTAAVVQSIVTVLILLAGVVLFSGALLNGSVEALDPKIAIPATGILLIVMIVPVYLVGFDVLPQSAEEVNIPFARVGGLLVISVIIAILFYVGISISVASSMPRAELVTSSMASADAATTLWNHPIAGVFLVIGGIGGILTSWNAFIIGGSRLLYALGQSGFLPAKFTELHPKFQTPWLGILTLGVLSCISPFFGKSVILWFTNAGSFGVIVAYIFVPIAFLVLRRTEPDLPRPYRVAWGTAVGWLAFILACGLLVLFFPPMPSALRTPEWIIVFLWGSVGVMSYIYWKSKRAAA